MKVRDIVLVLITAILLIWFMASWAEVQMAAVDNWQHTYCPLNMFVMLCEAMRWRKQVILLEGSRRQ